MSEPQLAQLFQGPLGQRHETIFVSFAPDAQEHPLRIDVANPQEQTFTESQATGINLGQTNPEHRRAHARENRAASLNSFGERVVNHPRQGMDLRGKISPLRKDKMPEFSGNQPDQTNASPIREAD